MAEFEVRIPQLESEFEEFVKISTEFERISGEIEAVGKDFTGSTMLKPAIMLKFATVCKSVHCCAQDVSNILSALENAVEQYKNVEKNVSDKKFGKDYKAKEESGGAEEEKAPKNPDWGKKPGSISPAEYAWLCSVANNSAGENNGRDYELMKKIISDRIEADLPEGHPLRHIDPSQIQPFSSGGAEGFVLFLDNHSAVVVFSGTDSFLDGMTDVAIVLGQGGFTTHVTAANAIIDSLEKNGFDNITVAGHSLGGYLATDVTLGHTSVQECVVFDPPGHPYLETMANNVFNGGQVSKIDTYIPNGSVVNVPGMTVGEVHNIHVEDNDNAGFHNHDIDHMKDSLGGQDAIREMYE